MQDAYLRSHNYVCLPRPICTNSVYLCDLSSSYQNDTYAGHSWTYSKYVAATYKWLLYKSNAFVNYISIDENAAFAWSNHLWRLGQVCERFSWHRRGQVFALFSVNWLTAHMKLTNWQADHLCVFKSLIQQIAEVWQWACWTTIDIWIWLSFLPKLSCP